MGSMFNDLAYALLTHDGVMHGFLSIEMGTTFAIYLEAFSARINCVKWQVALQN